MDLIAKHFGKPKEEIQYSDIEHYFSTEKHESDTLEFKSINSNDVDHQIKNLAKPICSFLNSDGGIIILGAPTGGSGQGHKKKFIGDLTPTNEPIEKDRFINIISDKIIPTPGGISLNEYQGPKGYIYLIEVMKSEYSPHQFENIYYMRLDGQVKPAPHHYVEALFKKVKFPDLDGYLTLKNPIYESDNTFIAILEVNIFNWSFYMNEVDLHYRLYGGKAKLQSGDAWKTSLIIDKAKDILPYGDNLNAKYKLKFTKPNNKSKDNIRLQLVFGGKYSPLRISRYELEVEFISPLKMERRIILEEISIWAKDFLDEKGMDRINVKTSLANKEGTSEFDGRITRLNWKTK